MPGDIAGYGKWDYNDDGIQDTLMLPDCGSLGCSGLWGDSIAGGFSNQRAGNIGNYLGVGPFSLRAGDTTEFVFYMGGTAADTLATNRMIAAATTAFFRNFAGASAYPPPTFTSNDVRLNSAWFRDSTAHSQTAEVRIEIKMPPRHDDEFLATVVARLEQNDPLATKLRALNPWLVDVVRGRMRQNLAQLLVFKSCDRGVSWTTDAGCTSNTSAFRTRDQTGADLGLGWRPFRTINVDSLSGQLSTYIVTDVVPAGREYLYSFVTKTRSLADIEVITELETAGGVLGTLTRDNLQNVLGVDIDTTISPLTPSGPQTVLAYAPISVPAGTIYARLDTNRVQQTEVTNRVSTNALSAAASGTFRMRFGNRFIITRTLDTVTGATTSRIIRQSLYARATFSPSGSMINTFVASADTFAANHGFTYSGPTQSALRTAPRSTSGSVKTFVDTITAPGYVIGATGGSSDPYYLAVAAPTGSSASFRTITQNTQEYESAPWFPGFTATVTSESSSPTARQSIVLRGPDDTLNVSVVNGNGVVYQASTTSSNRSGLKSSPGGYYRFEWKAPAFGGGDDGSGFFTLGLPEELQATFDASMAARAVGTVADTTASTRALIAAVNNTQLAGRPLLPARVPFRVFGVSGEEAMVAFVQRHQTGAADSAKRNSRLFGTRGDTSRVAVPPDAWVPGDTLYVIETIVQDSTVTMNGQTVAVVHDTVVNGRQRQLPIQVERRVYGAWFTLGCASNSTPTRTTCNPIHVGTTGATGHLPYQDGWVYQVLLDRAFDQNSEVELTATPIKPAALALTNEDMERVHVVPNPFIVQGAYDKLTSGRVVDANIIKFVNVPAEGVIRIYTVSSQLVQQLSWTQSDLVASVNGSPHGDLSYNLRSKEGLDLSSGLYLFVLTAKGANANGKVARGKFVIIR